MNNNNHSVLIEEGSAAEYDQEKSYMDTSQLDEKGDGGIAHQDSDPYGQTMADMLQNNKVQTRRKT